MAEKLDIELPNSKRYMRNYPWNDWLDGGVWLLKMDEDFPGLKEMRGAWTSCYIAAQRRGGRAQCRTVDDKSFLVQFVKGD